jgi:alpha-L-rhamnosidase
VPTDCPQRDERLGWTGDAQVFIPTAAYNMDVAAFFTKWQQDLADSQSEIGEFPPVIPAVQPFGLTNDGGPAWADAGVICPWTVYQVVRRPGFARRHFESMKRFVEYLRDIIGLIPRPPAGAPQKLAGLEIASTNAETPRT